VILLFLALQAAAPEAAACVSLARADPVAAERRAGVLPLSGTPEGLMCRGLALAGQDRFADAAAAFTDAARAAETRRDLRAADYWAQAGNAWLAAGTPAKARAALDAALAAGTLADLQRGEAYLDRARALVATGDLSAARGDLEQALAGAPDDPLAWLLSATLARRMGDLPRAGNDIAQALRRSPDDAAVQLEAGNIAAAQGDAARAQAAWREAQRLAPDAPAGRSATDALAQFTEDK
jgi:tetratricopeptide (TPR) repeat protein